MAFHTTVLLIKELPSQQKKCCNGAVLVKFIGIIIFSASGLVEWWNGFSKTQLQCQLGDSTLQNWGKVLQKAAYTLGQFLIYGVVSPIAKIHKSRDQGWKREWHHSPLTSTLFPLVTH